MNESDLEQVVDRIYEASARPELWREILTAAEARLAGQLSAGGGVLAAAAALGVSASTARTHLRAIFAKTGTRTQSELAVLLARSSQPFPHG